MTGGSQGLGRSLALLLAKKGANVTIVARNVQKLEVAIQELEVRGGILLFRTNLTSHRNADKTKTRSSGTIPRLSTPLRAPQQLSMRNVSHSPNNLMVP